MRSFRTIMQATTTLLLSVVVVSVAAYAALFVAGYKPVVVYSGSMVPALRVGSIAIDRSIPATSVRAGDVITFQDPYVSGRFVTHRVIGIFHTSHGLAYRTKGDANSGRDPWTVRLPGRVGRVAFSVPYAGYALWYLHTREVRNALILLAALVVLGGVMRRIWCNDEAVPAAP